MKEQFKKYGIPLTEKQESQFQKLLEFFKEWNTKINLSAIRDDNEIIEKHFVDSLLVTKFFKLTKSTIFDLGAGGGFPTLPLSILTESKFLALDSVGKKMNAVQDMANKIKTNVQTVHGRAEDFGQNMMYRENFPFVISRAVAPWPVLLELALPFVEVGGSFIAYQGPQIEEDLKNFKGIEEQLGGKVKQVKTIKLGDAERVFVEVKKISACPKKFPRKAGEPKRKPLS